MSDISVLSCTIHNVSYFQKDCPVCLPIKYESVCKERDELKERLAKISACYEKLYERIVGMQIQLNIFLAKLNNYLEKP